MSISKWLSKPYPLIQGQKNKLILVLGFGLFTYLFLLLYEPFGAARIVKNQALFLSGFGLSVALSLSFNYFLLPVILQSVFDPSKWTIKKELLYLSFSFFLISFFNYLYNSTIGASFAPQHSFFEFLGITFSIGIFPLIIMIFLMELYMNRKNTAHAKALTRKMDNLVEPKPSGSLSIRPETKRSEALILGVDDFLFATSDNNYSTIFYLNQGKVERKLLRLSMKNLEVQLNGTEAIVRCHRSYMVNKSKIKKFRGNARSLFLELSDCEDKIPVSRTFSRENFS